MLLRRIFSNSNNFGIFFKLYHSNFTLLKPKINQITARNVTNNIFSHNLCAISKKNLSTSVKSNHNEKINLPCNSDKLELYLNSLSAEYQELLKSPPDKAAIQRINFLEPVLKIWELVKRANQDILQLEKLISELTNETSQKSDNEMLKMANEDMENLLTIVENSYLDLINSIVPPEKIDDMDIIIELTAGVGGQEAMLFTQEMTNMYQNFAQFKGWRCETLDYDTTDLGGVRHATLSICGHLACKYMKYEGGVHRVQRVPKTEKSGRIHTSTMTIAVLPQPTDVEVFLDPKDLKLETMRASGAGGQHVNKTDSAVRITHIPSGFVVHCQVSRSQHRNQEIAKTKLKAMLYDKQLNAEMNKHMSNRKQQVGTAGRSEKVRTYNYVQDRISDHRLSKNYYNINEFLAGNELLNKLIEDLMTTTKIKTLNVILDQIKPDNS